MIKTCRIHRPHIMWEILFENGYHDYVYPDAEHLVQYLMHKYDITYDDVDVVVTTQPIDQHDACLTRCTNTDAFVFDVNGSPCVFGEIFKSQLNITPHTTNIYLKVLPLTTYASTLEATEQER
jgi:hypothetical protein